MSNRKRSNMQPARQQLPPIIPEDDGQLPFFKQDFFSDVALLVSTDEPPDHQGSRKTKTVLPGGRKLYTSRCILAYNSPVFEKMLGNAKKHDLDLSQKNADDIVELMCYLDPRVPYTINAQAAKQLLPLAEEYKMLRLQRLCENALYAAYEKLRKEYRLGHMPSEINEEYLIMADRYNFHELLMMCVDEHVNCCATDMTKSLVHSDALSEGVKMMILQKTLAKLNVALEKERKYKSDVEYKLGNISQRKNWTNKFELY